MCAVVADGTCLPPFIFTSDNKCPKIKMPEGQVLRVNSSKAPSNDILLRWLDAAKDYLTPGTLLLMDDHSSRKNKEVLEVMKEMEVELYVLPGGTGKVLDPVDNSFNSVVKHTYYQQPRETHQQMLAAIVKAYYTPTSESIQHYFQHIGYTSDRAAKSHARELAMRGYNSGAIPPETQQKYRHMYEQWRHNSRQLKYSGIRPTEVPESVKGSSTLDGKYWQYYAKSV